MKVNIAAIAVVATAGVCMSAVSATPLLGSSSSNTSSAAGNQVTAQNIHPYCAAFMNVANKGLSAKYRAIKRKFDLSSYGTVQGTGPGSSTPFTKEKLAAFEKLQAVFSNAYKGKTNAALDEVPSTNPGMVSYALEVTANGIRPSLVNDPGIAGYFKAYGQMSKNKRPTHYLILDSKNPVDMETQKWLQDCYGSILGSPNIANAPLYVPVNDNMIPSVGGNSDGYNATPSDPALATEGKVGDSKLPTGQDPSSINGPSNPYPPPLPTHGQQYSAQQSQSSQQFNEYNGASNIPNSNP
ncbi:hypothetical protein H4R33_002983 [Dimargaris cristalligena]|nr:hypothetical protein H4R33_002983 [Dimargaris cristalligena]